MQLSLSGTSMPESYLKAEFPSLFLREEGRASLQNWLSPFFRNHKNFLKINHKHPGQVNMQISL